MPHTGAGAAPLPPLSIKRVVSCFLLRSNAQTVAIFRRQATMPSFPSHWAPCSGSIEDGETPWEAAARELYEETNVVADAADVQPERLGGLFVDVPLGQDATARRLIRVYPFVVHVPDDFELELRGTEHDRLDWIAPQELQTLEPAVPALAEAFHHATHGQYLMDLPQSIHTWRKDRVNGAATLAQQALQILIDNENNNDNDTTIHLAQAMRMMRPTMVAICNALNRVITMEAASPQQVLNDMQTASLALKQRGAQILSDYYYNHHHKKHQQPDHSSRPYTIATFSRSSTLVEILQQFVQDISSQTTNADAATTNLHFICAKSTPGDEGVLLAQDLQTCCTHVVVTCLPDNDVLQRIRDGAIDLVVVGADCVLPNKQVVNKVGTRRLAETSVEAGVPVVCFADSFKQWDDVFPPPLEDIFECITRHLLRVEMERDSNNERVVN